jgi:undecaprenyl-diphosphatase
MNFVDALILGLVQGITEFLPISSSGHLVIVRDFLAISDTHALAVDAVLHFATTAAIITYFHADLWRLINTVLRALSRLPVNASELTLVYALLVGTIPAAVVGLLLEDIVATYIDTAHVVAGVLVLSGLFFMYAEWRYFVMPRSGDVTLKTGVLIGCFQALALIPGFSRAGATIGGGMLLGLSRLEASRFSFLLSIPITLGAGSKMSIDLISAGESVAWVPIMVAAGVAYGSALIVIHLFLGFIRKYTLWPFAWYSIIMAGLVGYLAFFT